LPNREGSNFAARSKPLGLAVLPELPVRGKYLMTNRWDLLMNVNPLLLVPKTGTTEHTRSFCYSAKLMANEADVQRSKLIHQFIFGQTERIRH